MSCRHGEFNEENCDECAELERQYSLGVAHGREQASIDALISEAVTNEREACAQLIEPKYKRSCDCESCYCRNSGDLMDVTAWDEATRLASAIRARGQK